MQLQDLVQIVAESLNSGRPSVEEQLGLDIETSDIYMKDKIDIDSELHFFDIEETEEYILYVKDGQEYTELFMLWHAIELIEEYIKLEKLSIKDTALRLIEYRIKDA
ncbi:hypothetical protein [Hymenobacter glacieicola]|uniref:Uncharacterized protein n=1 Tax=Hymenobacter glacieicola TaxID=1562124 RepID=A0ABQ1X031_9BACT|nr:hypothetical protein [Hymenobacter glacieicola]GGG53298.1 hypothetical protein GCM10011378_31950 [Hymenobacter glacieicola]